MKERHQQERKKLYMLKLSIFGLRIYLCNMSMKPYLRQLDNRCAHLRRATKEKILNKAGGKCEHCGKELTLQTMQMHHVVPASMDGTNNPLNLMCVCKECHHLIHGNTVLNNELVKKKLEEHPEVRQHGTKELLESEEQQTAQASAQVGGARHEICSNAIMIYFFINNLNF